MGRILGMAVAILACLFPGMAGAAQVVRVGGYEFPPFVENEGGNPHGVTLDLIETLNAAQEEYQFQFVAISSRRRYQDAADGKFDVMFFESPEWEWAERNVPVDFSNVFLKGGELFIALAVPGRGQEYFSDLKGKKLVGLLGYHYGFANFEANPDSLARDWNMKLVNSARSCIDMVLAGRADLAVVTDSYLWAFLSQNPQHKSRLLVSDRYDQLYNHRVLVRRNGPMDSAAMNRLLKALERDGRLDALWRRTGLLR